ncbi:unnamed protein product [Closterium sp. NIES-65]|nr:unnamed protein product [Closterium sp. NIES-65]
MDCTPDPPKSFPLTPRASPLPRKSVPFPPIPPEASPPGLQGGRTRGVYQLGERRRREMERGDEWVRGARAGGLGGMERRTWGEAEEGGLAATNGFAPAQLIGEGGFGKVYRGSIRAELLERGERGARGGSGERGERGARGGSGERGERGGTGERGEGGGERGDMDQGAMGQGGVGQGAMGQGAMVQVAVKQLREESKQGAEEFLREVLVLGRLNHAHLVLLWGYCVDGGAFLVYELMEGGSLDYALIDSAKGELHFSWPMRLKVAVEVAEALVYMHRCNFIHRDIKAANVLLKPDYSAKLTDFGMVRVGPGGQLRSIVSTRVMGTEGYIDPSYLETGHLGAKSDVYSFGVILLELLTGQRVLEKGNQLVTACRQQFQDLALPSRLYADPKLHGEYPEVGARQLATLAKHCLAEQRHDRPDMVTVLQQLKEIVGRT